MFKRVEQFKNLIIFEIVIGVQETHSYNNEDWGEFCVQLKSIMH